MGAIVETALEKLSDDDKQRIKEIVSGGMPAAAPEQTQEVKRLLGVGDWPKDVLTDYQTNHAGPEIVLYLFKNKVMVDRLSVRVSVDDWSPYIPWG